MVKKSLSLKKMCKKQYKKKTILSLSLFFWWHLKACGSLVPQPGIEPYEEKIKIIPAI